MRNFHVDVTHNSNIYYFYDIKAENAATAREKAIEKYMRKNNVAQNERNNITATAY
jgi:hypothetical protein